MKERRELNKVADRRGGTCQENSGVLIAFLLCHCEEHQSRTVIEIVSEVSGAGTVESE